MHNLTSKTKESGVVEVGMVRIHKYFSGFPVIFLQLRNNRNSLAPALARQICPINHNFGYVYHSVLAPVAAALYRIPSKYDWLVSPSLAGLVNLFTDYPIAKLFSFQVLELRIVFIFRNETRLTDHIIAHDSFTMHFIRAQTSLFLLVLTLVLLHSPITTRNIGFTPSLTLLFVSAGPIPTTRDVASSTFTTNTAMCESTPTTRSTMPTVVDVCLNSLDDRNLGDDVGYGIWVSNDLATIDKSNLQVEEHFYGSPPARNHYAHSTDLQLIHPEK